LIYYFDEYLTFKTFVATVGILKVRELIFGGTVDEILFASGF